MLNKIKYIKTEVNSGKNENLLSRHFYRRFSPLLTLLFFKLGISATAVTWLSLISALIGCFLISFSNLILTLIGLAFIQFWYVLDHVDGELARLTNTTSLEGRYLDVMLHNFVHPIIYFSFALDSVNYLPVEYINSLFYSALPLRRLLLFAGFTAGLSALIIDLSSTVRFSVVLGNATVEKISQEYSLLTLKLRNVHPVGLKSMKMKIWHILWYILCIPGAVWVLTLGSILRINYILIPVYAFFLSILCLLSIIVRLRSKLDTIY